MPTRYNPALDDLEQFSSGYFNRPDRSLVVDPSGPVASFSYGAGVFFRYLGERFGDDAIVGMWEESLRSPTAPWPVLVDTVLRQWGADFDTAFAEFAQWNLSTGARETPGSGYARAEGLAELLMTERVLPNQEPEVRVAPASTRYFEVPGGIEGGPEEPEEPRRDDEGGCAAAPGGLGGALLSRLLLAHRRREPRSSPESLGLGGRPRARMERSPRKDGHGLHERIPPQYRKTRYPRRVVQPGRHHARIFRSGSTGRAAGRMRWWHGAGVDGGHRDGA